MMHEKKLRYAFYRSVTFLLFLLAFFVIAQEPVKGQDSTFTVTVEDENQEHPHYQEGYPEKFAIDGSQDPNLVLERGKTYHFIMDEVPSIHPFYLTTSPVGGGGGQGEYNDGVTGNGATGTDTLIFKPSDTTPDTLYYNCTAHDYMGTAMEITGSSSSIEDIASIPGTLNLKGNYPNPFNPDTRIRFSLATPAEMKVKVFDQMGRKVMEIDGQRFSPGKNKTIRLTPEGLTSGIYLYQVVARTSADRIVRTGKMTLLK